MYRSQRRQRSQEAPYASRLATNCAGGTDRLARLLANTNCGLTALRPMSRAARTLARGLRGSPHGIRDRHQGIRVGVPEDAVAEARPDADRCSCAVWTQRAGNVSPN